MAKLARQTAVLFGLNRVGAPSGYIGVFGSKAAAAPAYSSVPNTITALAAWKNGWGSAVVGTNQPNIEDVNANAFVESYFINNISERGILDFDVNGGGTASATEYNLGSVVQDGSGNIYVSQKNANTSLLSNTNDWWPLAQMLRYPSLIKSSLVYDLANDDILASFNIDHVTKIGVGIFDVYFTAGLMTGYTYGIFGSCGTQDGVAPIGGDNNIICGGVPGQGNGIRSTTRARVFCWDANLAGVGALEDSGCISVNFA